MMRQLKYRVNKNSVYDEMAELVFLMRWLKYSVYNEMAEIQS